MTYICSAAVLLRALQIIKSITRTIFYTKYINKKIKKVVFFKKSIKSGVLNVLTAYPDTVTSIKSAWWAKYFYVLRNFTFLVSGIESGSTWETCRYKDKHWSKLRESLWFKGNNSKVLAPLYIRVLSSFYEDFFSVNLSKNYWKFIRYYLIFSVWFLVFLVSFNLFLGAKELTYGMWVGFKVLYL